MINVSEEFRERMSENRNFVCGAEITFPDGSEIVLDASEISANNNSITDGPGSSSFPIGTAVQKTLSLEILNENEKYKDVGFLGAKIRIYLDFTLSEGAERVEKGTYTVITPETYGQSIVITAYDDMYKADKEYSSSLVFPQTAGEVLRDVCSTCDINLLSTSFPHDDFMIETAPTGTFRDVIGQIAMLACGNARIDNRNRLEILPYGIKESAEDESLPIISDFKAPTIGYSDTKITGVKMTVEGEEEEKQEFLAGQDGYLLNVENPLVPGHEADLVQWIFEAVGEVPFRTFSGEAAANPLLEFMDACKVTDWRGNAYFTFITDVQFNIPGYTTFKNQTPAAERPVYTSQTQKDISRVEKKAAALFEKEKTDRELAVEKLAQGLAEAGGMFETDEEQPDGSIIRYLHDKPELKDSRNVIKFTSESIGISNDGGQTYPYGITLDGETITRILSAEGVNAEWIKVGDYSFEEYIDGITERVTALEVEQGRIQFSVSDFQEKTNSRLDETQKNVQQRLTAFEQTASELSISVQNIVENGVDKVTTKTGFSFNDEGLDVSREGEEMSSRVSPQGFFVRRDDVDILSATNEGVNALNLTARKYLTIGLNSRFEDYMDVRTACFYIGG